MLKPITTKLSLTRTKVGNEYIRGISGGEKKRVTIAEAMVTRGRFRAFSHSALIFN